MAPCVLCNPQRLNGEAEVSCTEEQLGSKRAALAGLREENRQCELNLEEYGVKLSQRYNAAIGRFIFSTVCTIKALPCVGPHVFVLPFFSLSEAAVKQMRGEMKHVLQKIIDNDERGDKAKQEMTRVVAQHRVALTKLREQERLTFMQEEGARVSENTCSRAHVLYTCCIDDCYLQCYSVFCLR